MGDEAKLTVAECDKQHDFFMKERGFMNEIFDDVRDELRCTSSLMCEVNVQAGDCHSPIYNNLQGGFDEFAQGAMSSNLEVTDFLDGDNRSSDIYRDDALYEESKKKAEEEKAEDAKGEEDENGE